MKQRNRGLDLLRAVAILLVLIDHSGYFFPSLVQFNTIAVLGFYGVELFFVLSGFLIGQIALQTLTKSLSAQTVKNFYSRRWLRTLPLYYVILIGFSFVTAIIYKTPQFHPLHFVFLQNFVVKERYFLSVAWSLAIEEWFYLLLPVFFLFSFLIKPTLRKQTMGIALVTLTIFLVRAVYVWFFKPDFEVLRVFIPLRFDSLMLGVLLAAIKLDFSHVYTKLQSKKAFLTGFLLLLLTGGYYQYLLVTGGLDHSFVFQSVGFTMVSFAGVLLIPFLENSAFLQKLFTKHTLFTKAMTGISLISYSLYLTHLEIFTFFIVIFEKYIPVYLLIPLTIFVTFGISSFTYRFIELPVLALRDRYFRRNYTSSVVV